MSIEPAERLLDEPLVDEVIERLPGGEHVADGRFPATERGGQEG